jgi:membrane carboxypeptidase/penicillin-binding protein
MKVTPKRTFLLRVEQKEGEKSKDVIAKKGVQMEVTEKEAAAFFGYFDFSENEKKRLIQASRQPNSMLRRIV